MIYKVIIGILLFTTVLYYIFCFLEIFGVIKFTGKDSEIRFPKMLIPFYYLIKEDKKEVEEEVHKPVKKKRKTVKFKVEK